MHELWAELGASMRALRRAAGLSLRAVEVRSGWGRGTLSQVETAKARPAQALVEWYDDHLDGDGVLVALYIEARVWHGRSVGPSITAPAALDGDTFAVEHAELAAGELAGVGEDVKAAWTIANTGVVGWTGRAMRRVGAIGSNRLIVSRRLEPLPDCAPGESVHVQLNVTVPGLPGTVVAHWEIVDGLGRACYPGRVALALALVVV